MNLLYSCSAPFFTLAHKHIQHALRLIETETSQLINTAFERTQKNGAFPKEWQFPISSVFKLDLSIFLQTLPDNVKKSLLFLLYLISKISEFPKRKKKSKKILFVKNCKSIFLIETVDRNKKATRNVSKWAQTVNDSAEFSNSKERSRKRFFCFSFHQKLFENLLQKYNFIFSFLKSSRGWEFRKSDADSFNWVLRKRFSWQWSSRSLEMNLTTIFQQEWEWWYLHIAELEWLMVTTFRDYKTDV